MNALGPGRCIAIPADIQKLEEVDRLVKELGAKEKVLHILVNNAGAAWGDTIDDYPVRAITISTREAMRQGRGAGMMLNIRCTGRSMDEAPYAKPPARVHCHAEVSTTFTRCGGGGRVGRDCLQRPSTHHQRELVAYHLLVRRLLHDVCVDWFCGGSECAGARDLRVLGLEGWSAPSQPEFRRPTRVRGYHE